MEKILVVDDEERNLILIRDILQVCNYEIHFARNGKEAIDKTIELSPDLVILDIRMPVMDGFEACSTIKTLEGFIPVIIVTGLDSVDDRVKGYQFGADEYINKPFHMVELITRVKNLIIRKNLFERMNGILQDIDAVTSYSQDAMIKYETDKFVFNEWILSFLQQFIHERGETQKSGHEFIILSAPTAMKTDNLIFWKEKGMPRQKPALLPQEIIANFIRGKVIYQKAPHIPIKNEIEKFIYFSTGRSIELKNYFGYMEKNGGVIGVNFTGAHGEYHSIIFKEIVLIINFFKTIHAKHKEIETAFKYTISALARASEAHDDQTGNHIVRVNEYAKILAEETQMDREAINTLYYSAQMHDVGKIMIPADILKKPAALTHDEFEIMKQHTVHGARILGSASKLSCAREVALYHHENYDGTGYPHGLKGEDIPLTGRIVKIIDIYDALRSKRPYKEGFSHTKACVCILNGDGRTMPEHFDPTLLAVFKKKTDVFNDVFEQLID